MTDKEQEALASAKNLARALLALDIEHLAMDATEGPEGIRARGQLLDLRELASDLLGEAAP